MLQIPADGQTIKATLRNGQVVTATVARVIKMAFEYTNTVELTEAVDVTYTRRDGSTVAMPANALFIVGAAQDIEELHTNQDIIAWEVAA